jgi:pimeloyl-ACP methyl ester carboxylesterase
MSRPGISTAALLGDPFREDPSIRPTQTALWHELFTPMEWAALRLSPVYYGIGVPRGRGQPVVVVPGFFGADLTLAELFWWLRRIGYRPFYSGLGLNVDCPDAAAASLLTTVRRVAASSGQRVRLIGHSLGGLIARSVALDHPELVEMVIALAAPFNDEARIHPSLVEVMAAVRRRAGTPWTRNVRPTCYSGHCSCNFTRNLLQPGRFRFRHYAVYSKFDGLVHWTSCAEDDPALNTEVGASHYGIIVNPEAFRAVAQRLASPAS